MQGTWNDVCGRHGGGNLLMTERSGFARLKFGSRPGGAGE